MELSVTLLIFAVLSSTAFGQLILERNCPERPVQKNFDIERYVASPWYDMMHYDVRFIPQDCQCGFAILSLQPDKSVRVKNCCQEIFLEKKMKCSIGKAVVSFPEVEPLEARLNVSFLEKPTDSSNYWVLSTDYKEYSIVYHCVDLGINKSAETFWLLSRYPFIDRSVQSITDELISQYFDRTKMRTINHSSPKCDIPQNHQD